MFNSSRAITIIMALIFSAFPFQAQTLLDNEISQAISAIANKSDMTPPSGWHWIQTQSTQTKRVNALVPKDPQHAGVWIKFWTRYEQRDPFTQLNGGMRLRRGSPGLGSAISDMFSARFLDKLDCPPAQRSSFRPGYVETTCSTQDALDDSWHAIFFSANGYKLERVWFSAPTKLLYDEYLPVAMKWAGVFFASRANSAAAEQQKLFNPH